MNTITTPFRDCTISAAATTWIGKRQKQEDRVAICPIDTQGTPAMLALLTDGMGGMGNGDLAADLIVNGYTDCYRKEVGTTQHATYLSRAYNSPQEVQNDKETGYNLLQECLMAGNQSLAQEKQKGEMTEGSGATLIALHITPGAIWWQSIGDSLLYLQRGDEIRKINTPHTWGRLLDRQLERGLISQEEADSQKHIRHALSSAVCGTNIPEIEYSINDLQIGDRYIIASDGLQPLIDEGWETMLNNPTLRQAPADTVCQTLMDALKSIEYEYQDNASFIVLDILPPQQNTDVEHLLLYPIGATPLGSVDSAESTDSVTILNPTFPTLPPVPAAAEQDNAAPAPTSTEPEPTSATEPPTTQPEPEPTSVPEPPTTQPEPEPTSVPEPLTTQPEPEPISATEPPTTQPEPEPISVPEPESVTLPEKEAATDSETEGAELQKSAWSFLGATLVLLICTWVICGYTIGPELENNQQFSMLKKSWEILPSFSKISSDTAKAPVAEPPAEQAPAAPAQQAPAGSGSAAPAPAESPAQQAPAGSNPVEQA